MENNYFWARPLCAAVSHAFKLDDCKQDLRFIRTICSRANIYKSGRFFDANKLYCFHCLKVLKSKKVNLECVLPDMPENIKLIFRKIK